MSVICYPTPGKDKALRICEAFAAGCGGRVAREIPRSLLSGAAFFYGVTPATEHLYRQAKREGRDVLYCDNAYFDPTRERYFRVTRNRLQHDGLGDSDGSRLGELSLPIAQAWSRCPDDGYVLLCPQSDEFMRVVCDYPGNWTDLALASLRLLTKRRLVVRPWNRNKTESYRTLPEALEKAWAVVTWSSASAITAILRGVPAFVMAEDCIARPVASGPLRNVDAPELADRASVNRWAAVVADQQWTLDEMRQGLCWRMLSSQKIARAA